MDGRMSRSDFRCEAFCYVHGRQTRGFRKVEACLSRHEVMEPQTRITYGLLFPGEARRRGAEYATS